MATAVSSKKTIHPIPFEDLKPIVASFLEVTAIAKLGQKGREITKFRLADEYDEIISDPTLKTSALYLAMPKNLVGAEFVKQLWAKYTKELRELTSGRSHHLVKQVFGLKEKKVVPGYSLSHMKILETQIFPILRREKTRNDIIFWKTVIESEAFDSHRTIINNEIRNLAGLTEEEGNKELIKFMNKLIDDHPEIIQEVRWINLSGLNLTQIPASLTRFAFIQEMYLNDNQIRDIDDQFIGSFIFLDAFNVANNPLDVKAAHRMAELIHPLDLRPIDLAPI